MLALFSISVLHLHSEWCNCCKKMPIFLVVALAALSLADAGDVLTLTDADFDSRIANLDLALVKFYAPWYVHFGFDTPVSSTYYVIHLTLGVCGFKHFEVSKYQFLYR